MKNALRLVFGAFCALTFSVAAQAADLVAGLYKASQVIGDVTYKVSGSEEFLPIVEGRPLPQGVVIKTGAKSTVSIEFNSGATALIRPNTQIEISKFEQALFSGGDSGIEEPAVSSTKMMLLNGEVVSNVKKLKAGSEYVVNSPIGAAGVRGTFFSVKYDPIKKQLTVSTLVGKVEVVFLSGTIFDSANDSEVVILELDRGRKIPMDWLERKRLRGLRGEILKKVGKPKIILSMVRDQVSVSPN
jgi:hypothetical protein